MNKIFLALTAIPALSAVSAAAQYAQSNANAGGAVGISNRIAQLETRLDAGIRQGEIDRDEARSLRQQLRQLRRAERIYGRDGIDQRERADLRTQLRTLRQDIRVADRGTYDRYDRYADLDDDGGSYAASDRIDRNNDGFDDRDIDRDGRWDDDVQAGRALASNDRVDRNNDGWDDRDADRDGRWEDDVQAGRAIASNERIDRNNDGWDDRDVDRDGRWDDDVNSTRYTGQGGPVEGDGWVVDETGGRTAGVPGLIGSLFGIGGVQVGQRVSGNLYAVPYEYRNQFRDNGNVYYRSDGNRIIEIDARTQTVLRIYTRETD